MEGKRLPKMSLQAHAHHTRYKGRPRKSWIDTALEGSGLELKPAIQMAHNRDLWRSCIRGTYDREVIVKKKKIYRVRQKKTPRRKNDNNIPKYDYFILIFTTFVA